MSRRSWSPTCVSVRIRDGVIRVSFEAVDRFRVEVAHVEMNYVERGDQKFLSMRPAQWKRGGPVVADLGEELKTMVIAAMDAVRSVRSDR